MSQAQKIKGPDAVSLYPVAQAEGSQELPGDDNGLQASGQDTLYIVSNMVTWEMVREETAKDSTLQRVKSLIERVIDNEETPSMTPSVKLYRKHIHQMTIVDGVIMIGQRIVVPTSLQPEILKALHAAHQGITMMCQRATTQYSGLALQWMSPGPEKVVRHVIRLQSPMPNYHQRR